MVPLWSGVIQARMNSLVIVEGNVVHDVSSRLNEVGELLEVHHLCLESMKEGNFESSMNR